MPLALLIFGLIMFVALVVVHEWGHYIAARRNGIDVEEFGIGFPPKAATLKKRHGTVFTLNWLPLGGFVKLKGEHDADTDPGTYGAAPLRAKVKVMLAGVGMNLLVAFVLFTILALTGMPKIIDNQFTVASDTKVITDKVLVGTVVKDSPAANASSWNFLQSKDQPELKLQDFDRLLVISNVSSGWRMVNGIDSSEQSTERLVNIPVGEGSYYPIRSSADVPKATAGLAADDQNSVVELTVERDGKVFSLYTELRSKQEVEAARNSGEVKSYLGVVPIDYTVQRSTWSAPIVAAGFIGQAAYQTLTGIGSAIGNLVTGNAAKAAEPVAGPVGIFVVLQRSSELGIGFVLMLIALISLTLAIMNALPIPALDGGRLFVTLLYRALKKPLTPQAEERIHGTGFALLMLLFVVITIVDIRRL